MCNTNKELPPMPDQFWRRKKTSLLYLIGGGLGIKYSVLTNNKNYLFYWLLFLPRNGGGGGIIGLDLSVVAGGYIPVIPF